MRISSINFATLSFERKKKSKKVDNTPVKKSVKHKEEKAKFNQQYENSYFNQNIMSNILKDEPNFQYDKKIAQKLSKLEEEKLELIRIETIKKSLSSGRTEAACAGIEAFNQFSAEQIKALYKMEEARRYELDALITGVAPKGAQEAVVVRLFSSLGIDKRPKPKEKKEEATFNGHNEHQSHKNRTSASRIAKKITEIDEQHIPIPKRSQQSPQQKMEEGIKRSGNKSSAHQYLMNYYYDTQAKEAECGENCDFDA